jgi:hypothetical protein
MTMTYTFHHDAGHGWLEVPYEDMMRVGVYLSDISPFSYARVHGFRPMVYLEEDVDLAVFMLAMKRAGKPVKWKHKDVAGDSVIRTYPHNKNGKKFHYPEMRELFQACEIEGVFA